MGSKGPHTLLEAILKLKQRGVAIHAMLAGGIFQKNYAEDLRRFCSYHNLDSQVDFLPQLKRSQLARFFQLQHVCVFPSLYPEAFGIVAAEAMASGIALVSTGGWRLRIIRKRDKWFKLSTVDSGALANQLKTCSQSLTAS